MSVFAYFPLVAAVVLAWQDFQRRSVQANWLGVFGLLVLLGAFSQCGWQEVLLRLVTNGLLLFFQYGLLRLFLGAWYGRRKHPLRSWLGSGDVWMLAALAPGFGLRGYAWFLTATMLLTLLVYSAYRYLGGGRRQTIPLVSALGIAYIVYIGLHPWL